MACRCRCHRYHACPDCILKWTVGQVLQRPRSLLRIPIHYLPNRFAFKNTCFEHAFKAGSRKLLIGLPGGERYINAQRHVALPLDLSTCLSPTDRYTRIALAGHGPILLGFVGSLIPVLGQARRGELVAVEPGRALLKTSLPLPHVQGATILGVVGSEFHELAGT